MDGKFALVNLSRLSRTQRLKQKAASRTAAGSKVFSSHPGALQVKAGFLKLSVPAEKEHRLQSSPGEARAHRIQVICRVHLKLLHVFLASPENAVRACIWRVIRAFPEESPIVSQTQVPQSIKGLPNLIRTIWRQRIHERSNTLADHPASIFIAAFVQRLRRTTPPLMTAIALAVA